MPFKVEFAKDSNDGKFLKGQIFDCYGDKWALQFERDVEGKMVPVVDKILFLIWSPFYGWSHIEGCYVKPVGADIPNLGICGEAETK